MVIYGAIVYSRAICSTAGTRRYRSAIHRALAPRLLADTVWLISFHDLINHSISARRRISGVLKASDRHKRHRHEARGSTRTRQIPITPPPPTHTPPSDPDDLFRRRIRGAKVGVTRLVKIVLMAVFPRRGGKISAQFRCCLSLMSWLSRNYQSPFDYIFI